jgi:gliding motility-associated-like protein
MNSSRLLFCVGFLFLFCYDSEAKNKADSGLLAKKDKIQNHISQKLAEKQAVFEKNDGQLDDGVFYRFSNASGAVEFYSNKVVFGLRKVKRAFDPKELDKPMLFEYITWEINLNSSGEILSAAEELTENVSYFQKSAKSIRKVTTTGIIYPNIYPNIDLQFYTNKAGELKYDFILHTGAKLSDIKLDYSGVEDIEVLSTGELGYSTEWGVIKEEVPFSYTVSSEEEVKINYSVVGDRVSFKAEFDLVEEEIILDPIYVDWSSYFYGSGNSSTGFGYAFTYVFDLDMDDEDNLYVTGMTTDRFPGLTNSYDTSISGSYDAYVCKMTPSGDSIIWFSYLGGSQTEYCFSLAVNSQQEPVVSGITNSTDFPITTGAFDSTTNNQNGTFIYEFSGYVTKFNKNGDSLIFSTFLGGSGSELIQAMVLDDVGTVYLTGVTSSSDFPTTTGAYQTTFGGSNSSGGYWDRGDAFLTKMKPDGTDLVFSTFIGSAGDEVAYDINISSSKDIYIVGKTTSDGFPVTAGSRIFNAVTDGVSDGFICKFNAAGSSLLYSKLMGGSGEDWFEGVYVNDRDEAYVAGISKSSDFYTTTNAYQKTNAGLEDAVIVKFNPGGQNVYYSTYLGGSSQEIYYSGSIYNSNVRIAANVKEEPIICGISRSNDFPVTADALQKTNPSSNIGWGGWNSSATITKLSNDGSKLLYGTYYGGSNFEVPGAIKLKRISCFTTILYGGFTASTDYPTTAGVYKESKSSSSAGLIWSGFISKFRDTLYTDEIELSLEDTIYDCDQIYEILNAGNVGADILWHDGFTQQYKIENDTGLVWVQATYGCDTVRDSLFMILKHTPQVPVLPEDSTYCDVFPNLTLDAQHDTIDATYVWSDGATSQTLAADTAGTYWVDVVTEYCGTKRDSVVYHSLYTPQVNLPIDSTFCNSVYIDLQVGDSLLNEESFLWSTGDTSSYISVADTGTYGVRISNYCGTDTNYTYFTKYIDPTLILPADSEFCDVVNLKVPYGLEDNGETYRLYQRISGISFILPAADDTLLFDRQGEYVFTNTNKCAQAKDTILITLLETPSVSLGKDSTFCDAISITLDVTEPGNKEEYLWNDNATLASKTITSQGEYWVSSTNKCGEDSDSVSIRVVKSPEVDLPADSTFCDNVNIVLDADMDEPSRYLWQNNSTDSVLLVSSAGKYKVTVSNYCGSVSDSMLISMITSPEVSLGGDITFCAGIESTSYTVGRESNEEQYSWSNGDVVNTTIFLSEGTHWVRISNKCATVADTVNFIVSPYPILDLGPDTTLCGDFSLTLDAGNAGMDYIWMPYGETAQTIQATQQITYTVIVSNKYDCESTASFTVRPDCVSKSFIPNAFSPNGDGLNDIFKPTLINFENYSLEIYNRWGEKIFESTDVKLGWDAFYQGEAVQDGVYHYFMRYKTTEDLQWQNVGGVVNVVR